MWLLLTLAMTADAPCLTDPLAAAKRLYADHALFYAVAEQAAAAPFSAPLRELIDAEHRCLADGELCAIDADPWTAAQDGTVLEPRFERIATEVVVMRFVLDLDPDRARQTHLHFAADAHNCQLLTDLIDPDGGSLRARLEPFHAAQ